MFTERINNSGFGDGTTSGFTYWLYVLPLGFLLTQYTITGFDACAHVSEETKGASQAAARGLWQSIAYSAIGGWILLLAFLFAATDVGGHQRRRSASPARSSRARCRRASSRPSSSSRRSASSSAA